MKTLIQNSWKVAMLYAVALLLVFALTNRVEKLESKEDQRQQSQNIVMRME